MSGLHRVCDPGVTADSVDQADATRPGAVRCPINSTCAGCLRPIRAGMPVRATPCDADTVLPWMHCACWWARQS